MKIVAISDLHIGPRAGRDAFGHAPEAFSRFLDALLGWADAVVLLGDVWQTDHGLRTGPLASARQLRAAMDRSPWLSERLGHPRLHLVHGNHDAIAKDELGARTALRFEGAAGAALFTHGDAFDAVIRRAPRLSATGTWICGRLRRAGLDGVAQELEDRDVQVKGARVHGPGGPTALAAVAAAREEGAATLVMGHTHVILDHVEAGPAGAAPVRLLNTGTCSRGRWSGVLIDTETGAGAALLGAKAWIAASEGAVCPG
jgi:UDP-2,3-diacylglucosamine pyrophosphatase LpxH